MEPWDRTTPGVLALPSGRLVRGRGLRRGAVGGVAPEFGLYLQSRPPPAPASSSGWSSAWSSGWSSGWSTRCLRWPDWWVPLDRADARDAFAEVWRRAQTERVEVACRGGRGRTGTALACLAVLDGVPAADAVTYVHRHYHPRAVETPWQRRYVAQFRP